MGQVGGGCLGWSAIVYTSSGMFRGKESSNRIELSRLVQDLLNFGVSGSLRLWGLGGWGVVGGCPPHMCTRTRMHARTRTHIYRLNMMISIANGSPHWGNPWEFPMMSHARARACACVHTRACARVWGAPPNHPPAPSTHPPIPQGGTPGISQNSIALELIKIFQFRLKIWNLWRLPHPWVGV